MNDHVRKSIAIVNEFHSFNNNYDVMAVGFARYFKETIVDFNESEFFLACNMNHDHAKYLWRK